MDNRQSGKTTGVFAALALLNLPSCVKVIDTVVTIHSAPAAAKGLAATLLETAKAIATWPWPLAASLSIGSLSLFAVYLFGTNAILRALALFYRRDMRQAELQRIASDLELKKLRAEAAAERNRFQAEATVEAQRTRAENARRVKEIRQYLKMLGAEDDLAVFDRVCPPVQVPPPPKKTEAEADRHKWPQFHETVRELMRAPGQTAGLHGLDALNEGAYQRIDAAGRNARLTARPEERGVDWEGREDLRIDWLTLAARLDQLKKEQADAKERLTQWADPLTRARKARDVQNLMPKDDDENA